MSGPTVPLENAENPALYRADRYGHFNYAIPVPHESYAVTMYFSEQWFGIELFGGGTGMERRLFAVFWNGIALLRNFDIAMEAGGALKGIQRTFRGLRPNAQANCCSRLCPSRTMLVSTLSR